MFQLTKEEVTSLISQNAMSKQGRGGRRTLPYAFTENKEPKGRYGKRTRKKRE